MASLSQGRTAAAHCGLFTHKSVPVIFEPPCKYVYIHVLIVASVFARLSFHSLIVKENHPQPETL